MGEVYRAHQLNLKRDVAIKVISRDWLQCLDEDEEEIETTFQRFRREVEAMAQIRHLNVLQIFDYDATSIKEGDEEVPVEYIAMEYIPGSTLLYTTRTNGRLFATTLPTQAAVRTPAPVRSDISSSALEAGRARSNPPEV